jgi:undecaprenyl-diphosphatase
LELWEAIVLGIIQGLTEFLPVSSSGHLALAQYFFGITEPQLFFDIMLHVGTLGAIIVVFQRDIRDIFIAIVGRNNPLGPPLLRGNPRDKGKGGKEEREKRRFSAALSSSGYQMTKESGRMFALLIVVGSVPTVIIALIINMFVERLFVTPLFVSGMLLTTGVILWLSGRSGTAGAGLTPCPTCGLNIVNALIIGAAQGFAVLPGISRSGATISAALMRGVDREEAARFSLLLSVPAILGAVLLELKDISGIDISVWTIIAGTVVAFVVGYVAIKVLLRTLRRGQFSRFAYYCWGIGVVSVLGYLIRRSVGL